MWKLDKVVFTLFILLVGCLTERQEEKKQQISTLLLKKKALLLSGVNLNCMIPNMSREKCPSRSKRGAVHWKSGNEFYTETLNELIYRKGEKVRPVHKWSQETHLETYSMLAQGDNGALESVWGYQGPGTVNQQCHSWYSLKTNDCFLMLIKHFSSCTLLPCLLFAHLNASGKNVSYLKHSSAFQALGPFTGPSSGWSYHSHWSFSLQSR